MAGSFPELPATFFAYGYMTIVSFEDILGGIEAATTCNRDYYRPSSKANIVRTTPTPHLTPATIPAYRPAWSPPARGGATITPPLRGSPIPNPPMPPTQTPISAYPTTIPPAQPPHSASKPPPFSLPTHHIPPTPPPPFRLPNHHHSAYPTRKPPEAVILL